MAFLFPGQGAQHIGMARGLYDTEPVFRETFDRCAAGFAGELGLDLKAEIFDGASLEPTDLAQPALFTVEYALAQLILSYGVSPTALAGHSIGELVAATVAGCSTWTPRSRRSPPAHVLCMQHPRVPWWQWPPARPTSPPT